MTTGHEAFEQHIIYSTDGSRPTIRCWQQLNGNFKATQGTSWITWDDAELLAFVNAIAELRPDILCDAPDDEPQLGQLFTSGDSA